MRTRVLQRRIAEFLSEVGCANSAEILAHVNQHTSSGSSMFALVNILAKSPLFVCVGEVDVPTFCRYRSKIWKRHLKLWELREG